MAAHAVTFGPVVVAGPVRPAGAHSADAIRAAIAQFAAAHAWQCTCGARGEAPTGPEALAASNAHLAEVMRHGRGSR